MWYLNLKDYNKCILHSRKKYGKTNTEYTNFDR